MASSQLEVSGRGRDDADENSRAGGSRLPPPARADERHDRREKHSFAALEVDPRLALVLVDISAGSSEDVTGRRFGQVVDLGIRERATVGVAGGMALTGMRHQPGEPTAGSGARASPPILGT